MTLYLMYALIILITIIFFIIIKDKFKALKITGILTISSAILLFILTFILKLIISTSITSINLSFITNYIFTKFTITSIILLLLGITEILISKYMYSRKKAKYTTIT